MACARGDIATVKQILEEDATIVNAMDEQGFSPLHVATINNEAEIFDYLMDMGGDLRTKEVDQLLTPLHIACSRGFLELVKKILEYDDWLLNVPDRQG